MTATPTIADVLERAADLIEPEGAWSGGGGLFGCYCAGTAIGHAIGDIGDGSRAARVFFGNLLPDDGLPAETGRIYLWNDAPGRTQAEVVARLREAAALAREQGK